MFDVSDRLRMRGWLVPAYHMPPDIEDMAVLRVVVRNGFGRDLASMLIDDLKREVEHLEEHGGSPDVKHKGFATRPTTRRGARPRLRSRPRRPRQRGHTDRGTGVAAGRRRTRRRAAGSRRRRPRAAARSRRGRDEAEHREHAVDAIEDHRARPAAPTARSTRTTARPRRPRSTVRSSPSTPGFTSAPSWSRGSWPDVRARPPCTTTASSGSCGGYGPGSIEPELASRSSIVLTATSPGRPARRRRASDVRRRTRRARARRRARRAAAYTRRSAATVSRAASTGKMTSSVPDSTSSGAGRDQRGDVEVLDRAELAGHDLRAAHVPRDRVRGAPRRQVAGRRPRRGRARRARRGTACTCRRTTARPRRCRAGSTSGCAREHVERSLRGPRGCVRAARHRPSSRTRDPSRSGTCRRASSRARSPKPRRSGASTT